MSIRTISALVGCLVLFSYLVMALILIPENPDLNSDTRMIEVAVPTEIPVYLKPDGTETVVLDLRITNLD